MRNRKWLFCLLLALLVVIPARAQVDDAFQLDYGSIAEGRIVNRDKGVWYTFNGTAGDVVTITASSDSIDTIVQLFDPDQNELAENDDISKDNLNAEIAGFELPEDGPYLIQVSGYTEGVYTLTLTLDSSAGGGGQLLPISYGQAIVGEAIDLETPVVYSFSGESGEIVSISVTSDEIDTYVILADSDGNTVAENDDVSKNNLNSYLEAALPATGEYLIGVLGYSAGPFTLELSVGSGGGGEGTTISQENTGGDKTETFTGEINDEEYFTEFSLGSVPGGSTITLDAQATSGDLDLYIGLFLGDDLVAENDDREQGTTDSFLEYPNAEAGNYSVIVTRYGLDQGNTSGEFELSAKVSVGSTVIPDGGEVIVSNPVANGYPTLNPTPMIAEWTVLVYMGGDNNLEDGLINDLDEFEIAGGSNETVRIIALFDRSGEYDTSNEDWEDTRIFEVTADVSNDAQTTYPPTMDTREIATLGELDTSYGSNLLDFLVWGVQNYPAQRYAISLNDHGGAWQGIVTDDTTGRDILDMAELQQAFGAALQNTGLDRFDLLINDACLMSSVEYYAALAPYFDYVLSSPEITLNPSFDMTLLTRLLNENPAIDIGDLGRQMADKYLQDMTDLAPDTAPVLGAAVTDLRQMDGVIAAVNEFAQIVSANPDAYGSMLGKVRANTYAYSFFLPEKEFGPATNIDLGSFMQGVLNNSDDTALNNAAQDVLDALNRIHIYGTAGEMLEQQTTYYNIYFPERGTDFHPVYFELSPLESWSEMLRSYFSSVSVNPRALRAPTEGGVAAPSLVPIVTVTNVYPTVASINLPVQVQMEVIGRNLARGNFTVDQIQPDGSAIRLDADTIVTEVVENGQVDYINLWRPGVHETNFTWGVTLYTITDGVKTDYELINYADGVWSIAGRYHYPDSEEWVDVTVIFDDEGNTSSVVSKQSGGVALASIDPLPGGEFQTFRSIVTPDGRVEVQPGTLYTWPENGISWNEVPAPSGQYNLGFLIEAFGGTTGFDSALVTVDNDGADNSLTGYIDLDWGFTFQRPADWSDVVYFPDDEYLETNNDGGTQLIYIYPAYDASSDLKAIAEEVLGRYVVEFDGQFTPLEVGGQKAVEFTFTYETGDGTAYTGRAFAVYIEGLELGLVFSAEAATPEDAETVFNLLLEHVTFYNVEAVQAADSGSWTTDLFTEETRYSVRKDWMPGFEQGDWWYYMPGNVEGSPTFAAARVLTVEEGDAASILQEILAADEIAGMPGYFTMDTETYYGENETWEMASFTHESADGESITGRLYVTVKNNRAYVLWFEAPSGDFNALMRDTFFPMLDSYRIDEIEE